MNTLKTIIMIHLLNKINSVSYSKYWFRKMVTTHNLGFPKSCFSPQQSQSQEATWQQQSDSDFLSVGCTGVADPMVAMMDLLGHRSEYKHFKAYEDAQWFGSDLRYVAPDMTSNTSFTLNAASLIEEVKQAQKQGLNVKPVIIGPVSYLWFGKAKGDVAKLALLDSLLPVYAELLQKLSDENIEWVQLDEPVLSEDLNEEWKHALLQAYFHLQRTPVKKLLASTSGRLGDNLGLLREMTVDGVHLDTISAEDEALKVADWLPNYKIISVAVVEGNQTSAVDVENTLSWLKPIYDLIGSRLWIAPSCSLAHLIENETEDSLLETAKQKVSEIKLVASALNEAQISRKAAA